VNLPSIKNPTTAIKDSQMTNYIGVDIGKTYFDAATLESKQAKRFKNEPKGYQAFIKWLSNTDEAFVAMEATGKYSLGLALFLSQKEIAVSIINPARIKGYAQSQLKRVKTDSEDAKLIAHFAMTQKPKQWQPDSPVVAQLQEWHKLHDLLIHQKVQLSNQQQSSLSIVVQHFQRQQLIHLDAQILQVEIEIKKSLSLDSELVKQVELLSSIKGIGEATSIRLISGIKDIKRFDKAKQLASFIGVTPRIRQSGSSVNSSVISKTGSADLRKALYMPALSAIRFNPAIAAFANRLKANGIRGKKMIVAVMRKLIHIVFAILKSGKPFDPEYKICA
jgi:transposase